MKRKSSCWLGMLAMLGLLTGCIESSTVVQVNKDGSGSIMVRDFFAGEAMAMLGGFDDMAAAFGQPEGDPDDVLATLPVMLRSMVESRAFDFGEDVRVVMAREEQNDKGWKGYLARFEFDDVTQIRMSSTSGPDDSDSTTEYRFEFEPGPLATLRLVPSVVADPGDDEGTLAFGDDEMDMDAGAFGDDAGQMFEGMEAAMAGMIGNMFKGMQMNLLVEVDGEIVETDARHRSAARPNRIALASIDMDRIMAHPEALQVLMKNDPSALYKLQEEEVPGLIMEDPSRTVTIQFR